MVTPFIGQFAVHAYYYGFLLRSLTNFLKLNPDNRAGCRSGGGGVSPTDACALYFERQLNLLYYQKH